MDSQCPSGDRSQCLNAAGCASSFPPTFSGDEPRPLETDFFRHVSLFFAHIGAEEEEERDRWASYLPENLRPGNIENYLEETDNPELYGNKYWWLSEENTAEEHSSFNQSNNHIRYSRVQLLELRKVMDIPENILKIKEEIEAECLGVNLGVNQVTKSGGTKVANVPVNSKKNTPQAGEKEKHEVANISLNLMKVSLEVGEKEGHEVENISVNSMKEAPQTGEKEKHEGSCYVANLQMRNVNLNEHRKIVGQLGSGPAEEQPKAKDCHLVYKRSRKKNMVANVSVHSMQGELQTGEKEKQEGFVSKSKKEKKKHRVLTDGRKEKRRIAKKKKRAEKNRKLGVKRLKIQPLLKPKPVSHCRHYLKGRCHEGENCKFSHDVQPLTKSLPCCHFARQSCMKGDDCPYDHDLSKYPCNKYVSTGFCSRQENCLFSHKVTPNQDPAPTTGEETKPSNPPPASDSIQRHSQKPRFVFGSVTAENSKGNVPASKADQPVKTPKGFTFLNNGNSQKDKQPVLASTSADAVVSGKNSNKTAFGGDQKGAALPSNPPASPNSAGVFVFGKNTPPDHNKRNQPSLLPIGNNNKTAFGGDQKGAALPPNPPTSPNPAGVFVFGRNSLHEASPNSAGVTVSGKNSNKTAFGGDQKGAALTSNPPASPISPGVVVSGKNNNKTAFGGDQKGAALTSNPPASPNPSGVFVFGKNPPDHNKRNQPSLLPFGNKKGSAAPSNSPTSAFSARLSGLMKNTSSSGQRSSLSTSASGSSPVIGPWANKNQGTGPVSGSKPVQSQVNVHSSTGTNSASADAINNEGATLKKPLTAVEVWEILYGKGSTR